ncbi:MAG: septal ring lytic transglycosylase RlpA family protein [Desulfosarcinaceae bacterium]|nr:septal ring lytic transglycosylase RlpA family protein [Desulfosarcinaceae bacterium]
MPCRFVVHLLPWLVAALLCACASAPDTRSIPSFRQVGYASYYADRFHGRHTANGERYHVRKFTAAHRHLPFGTVVKVRALKSGAAVTVRINDRGPFVKGRIIDLSRVAAKELGILKAGVAKVEVTILKEP